MDSESGTDRRLLLAGLGLAGAAMLSRAAKAGPLDPPPGPITSTGKTTQEIFSQLSLTDRKVTRTPNGCAEPRRNVESCPSSADAMFVITEPGAYCLTGDVTGQPGRCCIRIDCDDVDLDCQGFNFRGMQGTQACITATERQNIEIYDACFTGWTGAACVDLGTCPSSFVSDCTFRRCTCPAGYSVARCGPGSEVYDCEWRQCEGEACSVGSGSCVEECAVVGGSGGAIRCGDGSCITCCDVLSHQGPAFTCGSQCCLDECKSVLSHGSTCQMQCNVGYCVFSNTVPSPVSSAALTITGGRCCIEENSFSNCPIGIHVAPGADGCLIDGNQFAGGGGGSGSVSMAVVVDSSVTRCLCTCNCAQGYDAASPPFDFGSSSFGPITMCPPGDIRPANGSSNPWSNLVS
ncbi:MAG TPA: hypothetical protein VD997_11060 [Phycisphaerales bacterium]|nr:hypothetical protein [Phycisphaerales bacterium]